MATLFTMAKRLAMINILMIDLKLEELLNLN